MLVQSVKDMPVLQDGPPPGGFPSVRYARRIPSTGPTGFTLFAVGAAVMAFGFYRVRPSSSQSSGLSKYTRSVGPSEHSVLQEASVGSNQ